MSVTGFFSSIADKAQNAINQTPLAGHIPGSEASPNQPPPQGGAHRSFALESLQHQIRNFGQQYTSTTPVQRIITLEKGVALDFDSLARDGKAQSKEVYTWGQDQDPDLTDVTDRLAFLNFVHASLSASLAVKLDGARSSLKVLRDAEAAITPKRNIRAGLRNQIGRLEHSQDKGVERRLAELREQLARAERNDEQQEKEIELLKRKAMRESEQRKWEALLEYGEKLALLSRAAKPIIGALPTLPPTTANPYTGAEATANARASLQHALDDYKPGQIDLSLPNASDLSRSDTRSFGESHAAELSTAEHDSHPGLCLTPPVPEDSVHPSTVDLGAPVGGPLHDVPVRAESSSEDLYGTTHVAKTESAEEEKQRLEREERERVLAASDQVSDERHGSSESAEEEKKRLEREERERVVASVTTAGEELPPYQDIE